MYRMARNAPKSVKQVARTGQEFSQPPLTAGTIEISAPAETGLARSPRIPDIFVSDENIDMFPHFPLLRYDAIANARVDCPKERQCFSQSCG